MLRKRSLQRRRDDPALHSCPSPGCHSPFPVPDLGHQLLVALAQRGLLVRAHQAAALQEELGQWRAGTGGGQVRGERQGRGASVRKLGGEARASWADDEKDPTGCGPDRSPQISMLES